MLGTMPPPKKKSATPRHQDRHKQPRLVFHLPQDLYDVFKAHVGALRPQPNEAAVLRLALEEYLARKGEWPPAEAGE